MDDDKPTYEQIEQELNEYKELLWQLSDEYKLNLGNAERKIAEEQAKFTDLQNKIALEIPSDSSDFLVKLGMPSCIINNEGKIIRHNNKFKFLVELLSFEIEEIESLNALFDIDKHEGLPDKFINYLRNDESSLQSFFRVENAFQGMINLLVRIYSLGDGNQHLALFIELNKTELKSLVPEQVREKAAELPRKEQKEAAPETDELATLKTEIAIFSDKYELFEEIIKSPAFLNQKDPQVKTIKTLLENLFNLGPSRNKILEKLKGQFKPFLSQISITHPDLTSNEEKHCLLIKAGLTYKEIAAIMDITINGVKIARNRLRKKFDLENETKTSDFIDKI
jgi:DNA-binding CsgD family transcriptional regulator